ncbi:MAG TPA: hypothetical protein DDW27_14100 [Bacteroidales bacterium]|nr:hypothetical protein [Bacteroidales bacterium]
MMMSCMISFSQPANIKTTIIWDQAPHNAFTDLVKYRDAFYCTFREGSGHVPGTKGRTNG